MQSGGSLRQGRGGAGGGFPLTQCSSVVLKSHTDSTSGVSWAGHRVVRGNTFISGSQLETCWYIFTKLHRRHLEKSYIFASPCQTCYWTTWPQTQVAQKCLSKYFCNNETPQRCCCWCCQGLQSVNQGFSDRVAPVFRTRLGVQWAPQWSDIMIT